MGNAQILDVVQACGNALGIGGTGLDQAQELALILNAGIFIHAQVSHMQFVDHSIGNGIAIVGIFIIFPTVGIGRSHVDHHGPLAVDAYSLGIGVAGFVGLAINIHFIGVVNAIQIASLYCHPGAVHIGRHIQLFDAILGTLSTAFVQIHPNCRGSRCPDPEGGLFCRPVGAQVITCVSIFLLKALGGIHIGHLYGIVLAHKTQSIGTVGVQRLGQYQGIN